MLARQSSCKPIMELKYSIFCSMMMLWRRSRCSPSRLMWCYPTTWGEKVSLLHKTGAGTRGVYVQLSSREELIQRSSPSLEIFSAKESSVTKVPIKPCDSKTIVNSPRSSSGKPAQLHPLLGLREILMTSGTHWRPFSLLENQTLLYSI